MPFPLLFIGIAAATGGLGVGKTIKAGIDANNAKKINPCNAKPSADEHICSTICLQGSTPTFSP